MQKDILGKQDLDFLKIDWNFHGPGLMEGKCAATGTCENQPIRGYRLVPDSFREVTKSSIEPMDPKEVWLRYGSLFSE